jgi:hypothetical protein
VEFRHSGKRRITLSENEGGPTSAPSTPPQPGVGLDAVDDEKQPLSAALAATTADPSESSGVMGLAGIEEEL